MNQPSLFGGEPARIEPDICKRKHGGAATSVAANQRVNKETDRKQILELIVSKGSRYGCTLDEVSEILQRPPNQISGRFTELRKAGKIMMTEAVRPTRTGSAARVYIAI